MKTEEYEKKINELETDIATMIPLLQKATGISERLNEAEEIIQTLVDDLSSCSNDYQKDVSKAKKFLGVVNKKKDVFLLCKTSQDTYLFSARN